jgi:hypothetical protein
MAYNNKQVPTFCPCLIVFTIYYFAVDEKQTQSFS